MSEFANAKAVSHDCPEEAARRTARVIFARELADGTVSEADITTPKVLQRLRTRSVPLAPVRFTQRVKQRCGGLHFTSAVAAPLVAVRRSILGGAAHAPPRFLVRVDEFPHFQAWDQPRRFGTSHYERFHTILTEAGVPYCVAVLARVSRSPLDPDQCESRPLDDDEVAMLERLQHDGVTIALHGRDHRTRFASPRRRSELSGLGAGATGELLDTALAELESAGLRRPRVFVPPYNSFDAAQYAAIASRFDIICAGPETVRTMGIHPTPQWRDGALYLPSYRPLYGHAREVLSAADELIAMEFGLWSTITLHWGWESDDGWTDLQALVNRIAGTVAHWDELLGALAL